MIGYRAVLRLKLFFLVSGVISMCSPNSNIQVSYTFTMIGLIEFTWVHFIDRIPKDLTSGDVYKFQCGLCNESYYGECVTHLNVRIGEHIGILPLTKKQFKPKNISVTDHLLFWKRSPSYDYFNIPMRENKMFLLELKKSLLIMRDKPSLKRSITLGPLCLFVRP